MPRDNGITQAASLEHYKALEDFLTPAIFLLFSPREKIDRQLVDDSEGQCEGCLYL